MGWGICPSTCDSTLRIDCRYSINSIPPSFTLQHRGEILHPLAHNLAGLELHRCSRGDHEGAPRLIGVASNTGTGEPDFENAEVPQFHRLSLREGVGNVIESTLNNVKYLGLDQASFIGDLNH